MNKIFIVNRTKDSIYKACQLTALKFDYEVLVFNSTNEPQNYVDEIKKDDKKEIIIIDGETFDNTSLNGDVSVYTIVFHNDNNIEYTDNTLSRIFIDLIRPIINTDK